MSTRSVNNKRTTTGEVTGMARRSASSAKPARAAASSVRVVPASSKDRRAAAAKGEDLSNLSKEERKARKAELRKHDDLVYSVSDSILNANEEYKKRRKIWWALLIVAVIVVMILWVWMGTGISAALDTNTRSVLYIVILVAAYAVIIGAFVYDWLKIRPLRNEARSLAEGMSDKQLVNYYEKAAAEEDHARAEKEAAKAAKKSK